VVLDFTCQEALESAPDVCESRRLAETLRHALDTEEVRGGIASIPPIGGTSHQVDEIVGPHVERLGFSSQRRGLFAGYPVALRPDWFRPIGQTGILLEVERGKTVTNNMDLLDLWKCHICREADHLFLVVPLLVQRRSGTESVYKRVVTRLGTFFASGNETNVRSLAVFGYGVLEHGQV
jgi:hypothetical protein